MSLLKRFLGIRDKASDTSPRRISDVGLNLVKHFEGLYLRAYKCPADVWTIGYGHTATAKPGQVIDAVEASRLLQEDMRKFEKAVTDLVKVPLTQGQFDALVSFTFNVGSGALGKSTLLKKLNIRDYEGASNEFPRWNKGGGRVLAGLVRRREAERQLFLGNGFSVQ